MFSLGVVIPSIGGIPSSTALRFSRGSSATFHMELAFQLQDIVALKHLTASRAVNIHRHMMVVMCAKLILVITASTLHYELKSIPQSPMCSTT